MDNLWFLLDLLIHWHMNWKHRSRRMLIKHFSTVAIRLHKLSKCNAKFESQNLFKVSYYEIHRENLSESLYEKIY